MGLILGFMFIGYGIVALFLSAILAIIGYGFRARNKTIRANVDRTFFRIAKLGTLTSYTIFSLAYCHDNSTPGDYVDLLENARILMIAYILSPGAAIFLGGLFTNFCPLTPFDQVAKEESKPTGKWTDENDNSSKL